MAKDGDGLVQVIEEIRQFRQELQASIEQPAELPSPGSHEGFFDQLERRLKALAEQQQQVQEQLAEHERRLCLLEQTRAPT